MIGNCNLCESKKLKEIWEGYPRSGNLNKFSNKKSKAYRCLKCFSIKLAHQDNYDIKNFESGKYRQDVKNSKITLNNNLNEKLLFLGFISKYVINKNILDFGSGDGTILKLISNFNLNCVGIELDKNYHTKNKNFSIVKDFKNSDKIQKKYDVILSFSTFGMLEDLNLFFSEIKKRLNKNGILVIGDINAEDMLIKYGKTKYNKIFYRLSYKNYFSKKGINFLANKFNFIEIGYEYIERYDFKNLQNYLDTSKIKSLGKMNSLNFISRKQKIKGTDYLINIFKKI